MTDPITISTYVWPDGRVTTHIATGEGEPLGREIVVVNSDQCNAPFPPYARCALIRNHGGKCWEVAHEIADMIGGAFAVVVPSPFDHQNGAAAQ